MATQNNKDNNSADKGKYMEVDPERLESAKAKLASLPPTPTGLAGGLGEFWFWPGLDSYAPMINGEAGEFRLSPDQWEKMKGMLLPVQAVKVNTLAQLTAKAAPVKRRYQISFQFELEGGEEIPNAETLTLQTVTKLLAEHGLELDGLRLTQLKTANTRPKGVGAVTERRLPQSGGEQSGFFTATSPTELKKVSSKEWKILSALCAGETVAFTDYSRFGYEWDKGLRNAIIGLNKKGYYGVVESVKGVGWRLHEGRPYPGFCIQDVNVAGN